jgi:hypothetical protein
MMEAASTSETLLNFCQTTRRNIPEDSHLLFFVDLGTISRMEIKRRLEIQYYFWSVVIEYTFHRNFIL